jgi:hypothetical protein
MIQNRKTLFGSIFCLFILIPLTIAQTIKVQPYLQDATPNSIYIMWETDAPSESIIEWGLSESLGNSTVGNSNPSDGTSMIHEVKLDNLMRFTKYFYRVRQTTILQIYTTSKPLLLHQTMNHLG